MTSGAAVLLASLLQYSTSLTRTANSLGYASNFFDLQARAFMSGHIAVPDGSLGIEGFTQRGQDFMYFQPLPALVRIPVLLVTDKFDGRLTVLSMALAFALYAVMLTRLVWLVRDVVSPDRELGRLEAAGHGVLIAALLGGSVLTYVAALPWVYHEVYAWASASAVGALYWMIRLLREARPGHAGWLAVFCLAAVGSRTTTGLAMCLGAVAVGVWLARSRRVGRPAAWGIAAAGVVPAFAGAVFNWLKFRHPYMFPLTDQTWTELNSRRREALEANGGAITGPHFLPTTLDAYFRPDGIRFVDHFGWITAPAEPARAVGDAFLDQSYRTASVTSFTPWLLALSVVALIALMTPAVTSRVRALLIPLVSASAASAGVLAYGYIATRYTADFLPGLVVGSAIGTSLAFARLARHRSWARATFLAASVACTTFSMVAYSLLGTASAATTAGGAVLADHLTLQHRLTPAAQADLITRRETPPGPDDEGAADEITIVGDCDSVYFSTADTYAPWLLVERNTPVVVAQLDPDRLRSGTHVLYATTGRSPQQVLLQVNGAGRARVVIVNETGRWSAGWFDVPAPHRIRIGLRDVPEWEYAEVSSTPGGFVGFVRAAEWDDDALSRTLDFEVLPEPGTPHAGVRLHTEEPPPSSLCSLLSEASPGE